MSLKLGCLAEIVQNPLHLLLTCRSLGMHKGIHYSDDFVHGPIFVACFYMSCSAVLKIVTGEISSVLHEPELLAMDSKQC